MTLCQVNNLSLGKGNLDFYLPYRCEKREEPAVPLKMLNYGYPDKFLSPSPQLISINLKSVNLFQLYAPGDVQKGIG